ncbi:hypothetical protein SCAR479_08670 [Seiridium cardinale]|uniref:Uncharacterized protein n=1 Tax=Seiridium cardinale TaxID=138064 RepID=A0ABR2XL93_9PEZI
MSRANKRLRLDSPPGSSAPNAVTNATASDPSASSQPSFSTSASFASVEFVECLSARVDKLEQQEQQQSGGEVQNILKVFGERLDERNATISRQDAEIKDLRERVSDLHQKLLTTQAEHRQQLANATGLITSALRAPQMRPNETEGPKRYQAPENTQDVHVESKNNGLKALPAWELLRILDPRDPDHMRVLKSRDFCIRVSPLFGVGDDLDDGPRTYLIRFGPYQHSLLASDRKQPTKITRYWTTKEWAGYPCILELKPQGRDDINAPVLPRFVWELGEIYVVRRDPKTNQWVDRSSGYHLVVDVTSASKSMWMVYCYARMDGNLKIQLDVKKDFDPLWYPFAQTTGSAFDAAQVYAEIRDWNGPQTPVGQLARSLKLVKDTKRNYTSKWTFVEPNLEEVKEAIEKGWSGHPRQ